MTTTNPQPPDALDVATARMCALQGKLRWATRRQAERPSMFGRKLLAEMTAQLDQLRDERARLRRDRTGAQQ